MMPPSDSEEEAEEEQPRMRGQNPNAGMMPPSDSEDEDEPRPVRGQNPKAGMMPPSDSEEEDDDDEDEDDAPAPKLVSKPAPVVEKSQKDITADMERLALVRKRREEEKARMLEKHGYDIYKETAPGTQPSK